MEDLVSWVESAQRIAVRLYTGPGGMGKTRLMLELSRHFSPGSGWLAGFLQMAEDGGPRPDYTTLSTSQNLLIVVDYAETRRSEVIPLLKALNAREDGKCRVVLLARGSEDWWRELKSAPDGVGDLLSGPATSWHVLSAVAPGVEERRESFNTARSHFLKVLGGSGNAERNPLDLEAECFNQVLLLQMVALADLSGVSVKGDSGILEFILSRERRFWVNAFQARQLDPVLLRGAGQFMAATTLGGGVESETEALGVMERIPEFCDQPRAIRGSLALLFHGLYGGNKWIDPLQPDLLAEQLVQEEYCEVIEEIVFGPPDEEDGNRKELEGGDASDLQGRLTGALLELEERDRELNQLREELNKLKLQMFEFMNESTAADPMKATSSTVFAAALFLDVAGFSSLSGEEQRQTVEIVRRHAGTIIAAIAVKPLYANTWGDAIMAVFEEPNDALLFALKLQGLLDHEKIPARIGIGYGRVELAFDPIQDRREAKGPVLSEAARLEPMAAAHEVLISESLRYCPRIEEKKYVFVRDARALKKHLGAARAGEEIVCHAVRLRTVEGA